jgi:hypothetical protein
MRGRAPFLAAIAILAAVVACQSTPPQEPTAAIPVAANPTPPSDCAVRINALDLANEATIESLDPCRFSSEGETAAREVLAANPTGNALWAALWVYASAGSDPAPVRPFLHHADATVAVMASATLVAFGDASGFAGLAEALDRTGRVTGSTPPLAIDDFALSSLATYVVGADVPPAADGAADLATLKKSWRDWLANHQTSLVFSTTDGTWSHP